MPTLFRFLFVVAVLAGLGFGAMLALAYLVEPDPREITVPVQVNGRVRARLVVPADITEEDLHATALADPQVRKHIEGKTIKKVVVAGAGASRLVSIVVG